MRTEDTREERRAGVPVERIVDALIIYVNKDFFPPDREELMKCVIYHEIYEAYSCAKRGLLSARAGLEEERVIRNDKIRHILARIAEFGLAMEYGVLGELLGFYGSRVDDSVWRELDFAYRRVLAKREIKRRISQLNARNSKKNYLLTVLRKVAGLVQKL